MMSVRWGMANWSSMWAEMIACLSVTFWPLRVYAPGFCDVAAHVVDAGRQGLHDDRVVRLDDDVVLQLPVLQALEGDVDDLDVRRGG